MPFSNRTLPSPGAQTVPINKPNMVNQPSHVDDDGIEWTEAITKNGVPFLVGVKSTEVKDHREDSKRPSALKAIKYHVNWEVGDDDTWIKTPVGELHSNYISKYSLYKTRDSLLERVYKLGIYSVHKGVKYTFIDESGENYSVKVNHIGAHYIQYYSEEPRIVMIKVEVLA